jgi:soluble lytic murein transglycosylase-like protein
VVCDSKLIALARRAAGAEGLDEAVVCAVVEQESSWNPWAIRYEPLFFAKYVAPLYTNNKVGAAEAYARGFSWGLMQVMGQRKIAANSKKGLEIASHNGYYVNY